MKNNIIVLCVGLLAVPFITNAAFFGSIKTMLGEISGIVRTLSLLAAASALLFFFWGLAQFIAKSGDPSSHEEGKNKMVWGVIALFVLLGVNGILAFIDSELGGGFINTSAPAPVN
ncbi:MAG: hypothetical protein RJA61_118, partial [Candidatus Parcubacteria bacterium]